jgi:SAM-dependent methyltransferase
MTGEVHARIRDYWDRDSDTYDETRSHAISDPLEAAAWRQALADTLPEPGSKVLDVGAGTGALSLLAAELGYEVTALDLSPGMLGRAELKAKERGLDERMRFVVGSGTEATEGPFDAVMERHVLWTLPDPVGALARWREVSSRLVLFEGIWGDDDLRRRAKDLAAEWLRRLMRVPDDHHAPYPDEVLAELPLARLPSPVPLIDAVHVAGWSAVRMGGQAPRAVAARLAGTSPPLHDRRRRLTGAVHRRRVQNTSVRYGIAISSPPSSGSVAISSSTSARTRARSSSEAAAT